MILNFKFKYSFFRAHTSFFKSFQELFFTTPIKSNKIISPKSGNFPRERITIHPSKKEILRSSKKRREERKKEKEVEMKSSLNPFQWSIVRRPRNWSSRVCGHGWCVPFPSPISSCSRIIDHREPWLSAVKYNFLESLEMVGEAGVGETRFRLEGPR